MKTFTNNAPGARGINTADGTIWVEPGQSIELDPKAIIGDLPDLGKRASRDQAADTGDLDALTAKVTELTKQVETLTGEKAELAKANGELAKGKADAEKANAELTKQVETLTAPAK